MNPPPSLTPIGFDQHTLFVGTTGAGKTTRMLIMLEDRLNRLKKVSPMVYKIVLIDTKPVSYGQDDAKGHFSFIPDSVIIRDWRQIDLSQIDERVVIYRPTEDLIEPIQFAAFFNQMGKYKLRVKGNLTAMPLLIIVDELIDVFSAERSRQKYMHGFTKIMTQGRLAMQTIWNLTQYPVYLDSSIKRTSNVIFGFMLPDEKDRVVLAGLLGDRRVRQLPNSTHGFWYQNQQIPQTLIRPLYFDGISRNRGLKVVNGGR